MSKPCWKPYPGDILSVNMHIKTNQSNFTFHTLLWILNYKDMRHQMADKILPVVL